MGLRWGARHLVRRRGRCGPGSGGLRSLGSRRGGPGEELGAAPPRGGAGGRPERTRRGGPGTRGGAGPHTGRGGWLGPLRSRRRREEEARRLEEEGGGGGRGWSAARRTLTSPAQQGKVPRALSSAPAPGPLVPWSPTPSPRSGAGRGCGRRGRARGPERPRGSAGPGLRRPARRSGRRAGVRGVPSGGRGAPSLASRQLRRAGAGGPGLGAARAGGGEPQGSAWTPGGRAPWAQTKPGADAPRRIGRPEGGRWGRRESSGAGEDAGRGWAAVLPGIRVVFSRGPRQGGEQLSPKGQRRGSRAARQGVACVEGSLWERGWGQPLPWAGGWGSSRASEGPVDSLGAAPGRGTA